MQKFVIPTSNFITSILLGGILNGIGMGIIFRSEGSVGGTDILAKIVNKFFSFGMGSVIFAINMLIMLASIFVFGIDLSIITAATMFVSSRVTNFVVDGLNHRRTVSIITSPEASEVIAKKITEEMFRGVTIVPAIGGYTHHDKFILYTTVTLHFFFVCILLSFCIIAVYYILA
ncbi:MAG: YitT family protein [Niameybacter sp.]